MTCYISEIHNTVEVKLKSSERNIMSNEIVKYHNDMSSVSFKDFTLQEKKIYYAVCAVVKGRGTETVDIYFKDLKNLSGFVANDNTRFIGYIDVLTSKLFGLYIRQAKADGGFKKFVLFPKFETKDVKDPAKARLSVQVSADFAYILNSDPETLPQGIHSLLNAGYTNFKLEDHNKLKSIYSSALFTNLKRFKRTGWWQVSTDEFKRLMDIPKSYRMPDIRRRVIEPSMKELEAFFEDLKLEEYKGGRSGQTVVALKFTFKPQEEKTIWHDDDTFAELEDKYKCPYCKGQLYAIIKNNGDVFYGHRGGWKANAPCRHTFGSLEEIRGMNGDAVIQDKETDKEQSNEHTPKISKAGFSCRECGNPLYKLYNEKGELFYGHIDGWKKNAPCRKTYGSIAEIKGYSETPGRSEHEQIYDLKEENSNAKDVFGIFKTLKNN